MFDTVIVWEKENQAIDRATRALRLKGRNYGIKVEPFAAVINCTSSRKVVDGKARSKWAHALMFAQKYKSADEPLVDFIRRQGGINACAAELSRLSRNQAPRRGEAGMARRVVAQRGMERRGVAGMARSG